MKEEKNKKKFNYKRQTRNIYRHAYDSIKILASNSLREAIEKLQNEKLKEKGNGRNSQLARKRSDTTVRHFEADWAVFLNRKHDDFTLAFPPPSITPANCFRTNFFPRSFRLSRTTSLHVQGLAPPFPFTCSRQPSRKLLQKARSRRSRIPNYGFVFPRRYLLFHGSVHRMNEQGKPSKGKANDCLSHPYFSLSSFSIVLYFFSFSSSFFFFFS